MIYKNNKYMVDNLTSDLLDIKIIINKMKKGSLNKNMNVLYHYIKEVYGSTNLIEVTIIIYRELEKIDKKNGIYNRCYNDLIRSLKADYNIA